MQNIRIDRYKECMCKRTPGTFAANQLRTLVLRTRFSHS